MESQHRVPPSSLRVQSTDTRPESATEQTTAERVVAAALLTGVLFATAALTSDLPLLVKALVSLGAALLFWEAGVPLIRKGIHAARTSKGGGGPAVRDHREADELPERIAERLDRPMTVLGVLFLLLVVAETVVGAGRFSGAFQIASWAIWASFAAEFAVRLWAAPARAAYLRRNWWQLIFLVVPFLRFLRLIRVLRLARAGRVVSSAVRSVRSATHTLTGRLGWLLSIHAIVVLSASQLLFEFGGIRPYGEALAATALSAVAGEPTGGSTAFARAADIALAMYAAVMFAALAGVLAAFFLERRAERAASSQLGR